jgi:peptidylprolyl isomerase/peptidyl-prolyl cis-trans isomerase B (cyclophilin B)
MRLRWFLVLASLVLLLVPAKAQEQATAEAEATIAEFRRAYEEWRKQSRRLQEIDTLFRNSNEEHRERLRDEYAAAIDASNAALTAMIPLLEAANRAKPKDRIYTDLMVNIARLAYDGDRYEIARPLAEALAKDFADKPSVQLLAGLCAYEMSDLKSASAYLQRARELGGLAAADDRLAERLLANMPRRQPLVEAELAHQAEDASGDNLPRVMLRTTRGDIVIELFEDDVPNTVSSFVWLVEQGFYNDLEFFRVISGFGAITGSPTNDGQGGPGYEILKERGPRGDRLHLRGAVSMIPASDRTNGSQFFIAFRPSYCERLDGQQTVFGRVIEGMDVAERLHRVEPHAAKGVVSPDRVLEATMIRKRDHEYASQSTLALGYRKYQEGVKLFAQKKNREAEVLFREAYGYLPDNPAVCFNLAAALLNQKQMDEAEKYLRETLRLNPKHAKAHHFLGYTLATKNRKDEAIEHVQEALRLDPTHSESRDLLKKLQLQ